MAFRADDQLPAKRYSLRQVETYEVQRPQFDSIEREAKGIGTYFASATATIPVAITLNVTLKTVTIQDQSTALPIWALMWACYILGAVFSVLAFRQRGALQRFMQDIRDSQVAPVAAKEVPVSPDLTATDDPDASPVAAVDSHEADES